MVILKMKESLSQQEIQDLCLGYDQIRLLFNAGPFPGGGDCLVIEADGEMTTANSNDLIHDLEAYELSSSKDTLPKKKVVLSTEDEIDLADEEGFTYLFNGIVASVFDRLKDTDEFAEKGWPLINDVCLWELNYVAGQLRHMGSQLDIPFLIEQFGVQWDILAEKFKSERDDYGEDEDDKE